MDTTHTHTHTHTHTYIHTHTRLCHIQTLYTQTLTYYKSNNYTNVYAR